MKWTMTFEYPLRPGEGKVAAFSRMMREARKVLRERIEHPERYTNEVFKRGPGRPRKERPLDAV